MSLLARKKERTDQRTNPQTHKLTNRQNERRIFWIWPSPPSCGGRLGGESHSERATKRLTSSTSSSAQGPFSLGGGYSRTPVGATALRKGTAGHSGCFRCLFLRQKEMEFSFPNQRKQQAQRSGRVFQGQSPLFAARCVTGALPQATSNISKHRLTTCRCLIAIDVHDIDAAATADDGAATMALMSTMTTTKMIGLPRLRSCRNPTVELLGGHSNNVRRYGQKHREREREAGEIQYGNTYIFRST